MSFSHFTEMEQQSRRKCKHCGKYNIYKFKVLIVDRLVIYNLLKSLANWCDDYGGELMEGLEKEGKI